MWINMIIFSFYAKENYSDGGVAKEENTEWIMDAAAQVALTSFLSSQLEWKDLSGAEQKSKSTLPQTQ